MSTDLEEVDVEKQLKKAEESNDDTESIILSEKSDLDTDDEEEDNKVNWMKYPYDAKEDDIGQESDIEANDEPDDKKEEIKLEIVDNPPLIEGDIPEGLQEELDKINTDEDEDEDEDDEEYNENLRKLENDINKDYLYSYHPETKHINYKELLTLSNVTRNKKGIIIDPLHQTIPLLTRYEKAKILGLRAKQINHGAKPFVELTKDIIDGHTIAFMELTQNKIPFIIRRPMPNGGSEYWKISDLKNLV
jgi:DNA-directed RNA polymerase I, II, and III subunit RPABC2